MSTFASVKIKIIYKILIIITTALVLLFINNNYFKKADNVIKADGAGYYDYLPSIFIYKDFNRKNNHIHQDSIKFKRIFNNDFNVDFNKHKVNKYPIGTALLQSPFFFAGYLIINLQKDSFTGFEMIFQKGVLFAAIFYLLLGLYFLFKLLRLFNISRFLSLMVVFLTAFGTNIIHYTTFDASYSHVFSFALISGFLFFTKLYISKKRALFLYVCFTILGLIALTRQINILIVLFVPFLFDSVGDFKNTLLELLKHDKKRLTFGFIIMFSILSLQSLAWYYQTGHWILYSYQNEHFNFLEPEVLNLLFSYRKGLFVYTPLLFLTITIFTIYYILKKDYFHLITWFVPFLLISYTFSCWWSWFYGNSLGMRVFVDYYTVFMLPFAIVLNTFKLYMNTVIICVSLMFIPYSFILNYQYKHFIIHWIDMNKPMFWYTFLKYDSVYKGLVWLNKDSENLIPLKKIKLGDRHFSSKNTSTIYTDLIPENNSLSLIKVCVKNNFNPKNTSAFKLNIYKAGDKKYFFTTRFYLFHLSDYKSPSKREGEYLIKLDENLPTDELFLQLEFISNSAKNDLYNLEITYY